jgi:HD-like signal output (HDOD) protein
MWVWLDRLFGRDRKAGVSATGKAPAPQEDPPLARVVMRVVATPPPDLGPFEHFISLQGLEAPAESVLTPEEVAGDEALAAEVMTNFRQNQPGPSSLPAVALQVLNAVADQEVSLGELSRLVSQDPAMSAGVLRVANSAAYASAQEAETLRDAVTRLGLSEVGRVAGTVAARSLFQPQVRSEFAAFGSRWNEIFAESVVAARGAAWLAMQVNGVNADHVFLAGLLHDLGRSVALRSMATLAHEGRPIDPLDPRVDRVLERVHVDIGGDVHQLWNLPRFPTLVAVRHHDLGLPVEGEYREVHVVRLCSALVQFRRQSWRIESIRAEVDESCLVLGQSGFGLRSLDTQLRAELSKVALAFADKPRRRAVS